MRREPGFYEKLWTSGSVWRAAAQAETRRELAQLLGVTPNALDCGLAGLRDVGLDVPSVPELLRLAKELGGAARDVGELSRPGEFSSAGEDWEVEKTSPDLAPVIEAAADIQKADGPHEVSPAVNLRGAIPFGTPMQRASAEAFVRLGSIEAAAAEMQLTPEQLRAHLSELERKAAARGWAPGSDMTRTAPQGYSIKGVSTLYGGDGEIRGQWVKTKRDDEQRLAALLDAVQGIAEPFRGTADPSPPPTHTDDDLLAVFPWGDPHYGLYSWAEETGEDFDLAEAERLSVEAVDHLVGVAPAAKQALILSVGDTAHADSMDNRTARGGHALDVDTRWSKVLRVIIRSHRRCIDRALEKYQSVEYWSVPGNHDPHTAIVIAVCLAQYYEREPRVHINTSPSKFMWKRFGKCLLGATHGDMIKPERMPSVMAHDCAEDWGQTKHRTILSGHLHHQRVLEHPGCTVVTLRTLAAKDAWHAASGYRSGRDMRCMVFHKEHGQISEHIVNVGQLEAKRAA